MKYGCKELRHEGIAITACFGEMLCVTSEMMSRDLGDAIPMPDGVPADWCSETVINGEKVTGLKPNIITVFGFDPTDGTNSCLCFKSRESTTKEEEMALLSCIDGTRWKDANCKESFLVNALVQEEPRQWTDQQMINTFMYSANVMGVNLLEKYQIDLNSAMGESSYATMFLGYSLVGKTGACATLISKRNPLARDQMLRVAHVIDPGEFFPF